MGAKYSATTVVGYKGLGVPDDGSTTALNQVKYSTIYTDLTDPLKVALDSINTQLVASALNDFNFDSDVSMDSDLTVTGALTVGSLNILESGTRMLFQQTAAPTGWTKEAVHNDKALRVTTATAETGGTVAFNTVFSTARTSVAVAGHAHTAEGTLTASASTSTTFNYTPGGVNTVLTQAHTHSIKGTTGTAGTHSHPTNLNVQYVDVIIAVKD